MACAGKPGWRIFIDRGGTFTDIVARTPDGRLVARKLLSENPGRYDDPVLAGIREVAGLAADASVSALDLDEVRVGTTVATNALLERRGARTLLVVTRGFRDALRIGYQNRPKIFAREIVLPEPLYERVIEIDERVGADGTVLRTLDFDGVGDELASALADGIESAAVAFMHGFRFPQHERAVATFLRDMGFSHVVASHEVAPLIKFVARGDTAVGDAYLAPVLRRYTRQVVSELSGASLFFMQSNGGLARADRFRGKDSILSGPAGGIVGASRICEAAGITRIIAFDMGGTSTDVSHYDGALERESVAAIGGLRIQAPTLRIHTVAAGGGSKLKFDGARFRVGPDSAGAHPGPACYRKGGPLTITDCNVMVGKIQPEFFPKAFGPGNDQAIDGAIVREMFAALADEIRLAGGPARSPEQIAEGFLTVAVQNMTNAIKRVSVQRGHDVTRYTLCCFGGAGGQHACLVADALGMTRVFVPAMAGVLSALGLSLAEIRTMKQQSVERLLDDFDDVSFAALYAPLEEAARRELEAQDAKARSIARRVYIRYRGSDSAMMFDYEKVTELAAVFTQAHRHRFGFADPEAPLVVATIEVEASDASGGAGDSIEPTNPRASGHGLSPVARTEIFSNGNMHDAAVFSRDSLGLGDRVHGPAIIVETDATTVIEPGWQAETLPRGHLLLTRVAPKPVAVAAAAGVDPVALELFNNFFMAIAERMGAALAETAHSVNIKERLDFSCAIFDAAGGLVANAPHVPVHLGSMGESVRAVIGTCGGSMRPGDSFALNAPYRGGTHLPDITVVTPIFDSSGNERLFFVASRGHHADVGGATPGSMPPDSRVIADEGVLLDGLKIVAQGKFLESEVRSALSAGPWPARNPDLNVLDLKAQIAANAAGACELLALISAYSLDTVRAYMRHVQDNAEESVRRVLARMTGGAFVGGMDDGSEIRVRISIDRALRNAVIDFSGTSGQRENNFNAPLAVTRAAVLYVFRTLVDDDIPLNEGCMRPLRIVAPEGSILHPRFPAAVAAGNVETSQCVTDVLFAALGALAASQGTMNNFTFGDSRHQYYETLCGGAGAGPGFEGASAVHTHMTNSRLTDPEIFETRFPVVLEEFSIRRGSGGPGEWRGGDGVVRKVRFLAPMEASILSTRRRVAPFGLAGGGPGKTGRNRISRADGTTIELSGTATVSVGPGDVFVIETPGGGGYGKPD